MPQVTINKGDTLSALAQKYGTTVGDLVAANKGNPSVKSANLIIAGGALNLPEKITSPATGPTDAGTQIESGSLAIPPQGNEGARAVGELANFRISLREALNEAGRKRIANSYQQVAPLAGGVPGTIGSVVEMIRSGVKAPIETTFSDITSAFKEVNEARKNEQDRINQLRLEYGSAIPSTVASLDEAINLVTPLIDEERRIKLQKLQQEQTADNDIESWAQSVAEGRDKISSVPIAIRTKVKARAEAIMQDLEEKGKKEYQDTVVFRLERKQTDFETERGMITSDQNLNVSEKREMLDFIDNLEVQQKAAKKAGAKGFFSPSTSPPLSTDTYSEGIFGDVARATKPFTEGLFNFRVNP